METSLYKRESYDNATGAVSRILQPLGGLAGTAKVVVPALAAGRKKKRAAIFHMLRPLFFNLKFTPRASKYENSLTLPLIYILHFLPCKALSE